MLLFLLFLLPILATGIIILQKISNIRKFELLFPAGGVFGLTLFTFLLNSLAFIVKGKAGIISAYILVLLLGLVFLRIRQAKKEKIIFPKGRQLIYWLTGTAVWGGLIFWKAAHALIGSDTNLYYAVAHSFVKGNFPILTPWQPDIPLSYHTGASELLGGFYFLTGLDFGFLHLIFAAFFIFCIAQIIIWIIFRSSSAMLFLFANLAAVASLVSFGFFYLIFPVFPLNFGQLGSIRDLVLWLRNLPNAASSVEVYGAPFNLDGLIYFIFHAFGLAIFFTLLVMLLNFKKGKFFWGGIFIGLATLALVNESVFLAAIGAAILGLVLTGQNIKKIFFFCVLLILTAILQGGVISSLVNPSSKTSESVIIFPKKMEIKEDFQGYHKGQESFKLLAARNEWLPFRWAHPGIAFMMMLSIPAIFIFKNFQDVLTLRFLFAGGLFSLLAYNFIVPKFLIANGNRFLSTAYIFFSLILSYALIHLFQSQRKKFMKILIFVLIGWIFIPTILPSLTLLSKTRFGENKLIPKYLPSSEGIKWLKNNAVFNERVLVLDKNAPHPSGQARAMVEAGVFAPVFTGDLRAYTIEASPEYIDAVYYLSPRALEKLKIALLLIDNTFLKTLPEERRSQLENENFFVKMFDSQEEKIYRIQNEYLKNGGEIDGTFAKMESLPLPGKIYIDNEENFNPSYLRRALIFSLRDKDIYYLPQSGVYLNVEVEINSHPPNKEGDYDYLVLGKNTDPEILCQCQAELIWQGVRDEVLLWKASR